MLGRTGLLRRRFENRTQSVRASNWGCYLLLALLLPGVFACAPRQAAQVVERKVFTQRELDEQIGGRHVRIVQRGDTMYSIAFANGLDVNDLAAWNGISDTKRLKAGQRIRLTKPIGVEAPRPVKAEETKKPTIAKKASTNRNTRSQTKAQKSTKRVSSRPAVTAPKVVRKKQNTPVSVNGTAASGVTTRVKEETINSTTGVSWSWPLRGTLVARFNPSKGEQGIKIQGQRGQAVSSSAAGEVVYAGDSLKGYGNLIIIKHSREYLSAYAYNQKILVKEGQRVVQGQRIGTLGGTVFGNAVSQFQIRKNGNPVDPLQILPR